MTRYARCVRKSEWNALVAPWHDIIPYNSSFCNHAQYSYILNCIDIKVPDRLIFNALRDMNNKIIINNNNMPNPMTERERKKGWDGEMRKITGKIAWTLRNCSEIDDKRKKMSQEINLYMYSLMPNTRCDLHLLYGIVIFPHTRSLSLFFSHKFSFSVIYVLLLLSLI